MYCSTTPLDENNISDIRLAAKELPTLPAAQQLAWTSSLLCLYGASKIKNSLKQIDVETISRTFHTLLEAPPCTQVNSDSDNTTSAREPAKWPLEIKSASKITTRHGTCLILHCKDRSVNNSTHDTAATGNEPETQNPEIETDTANYAIFVEFDAAQATLTNLEVGEDHSLWDSQDNRNEIVRQPADLDETLTEIARIWQQSLDETFDETSQTAANMYFVRAHLTHAGHNVDPLTLAHIEVDSLRGLTPSEVTEANRAAATTLRAALKTPISTDEVNSSAITHTGATFEEVTKTVAALFHATDPAMSSRQRQGLIWLEWADWIGFVVTLTRSTSPQILTGATCVNWVNRCPEISSDIPAKDREYAEWVFEIILITLTEIGLITKTETPDEYNIEPAAKWLAKALISVWTNER